jgi:hypothetical protein
MEKESIDFQLSKNLEYSRGGQFEQTATIVMKAPGPDVFEHICDLSQLVMLAFTDAQKLKSGLTDEEIAKAEAEKEDKQIDPEEIKVILLASTSVKFTHIAQEFKKLAANVCEVAENEKLTPVRFEKIEIDDRINMICTYIANFITPSLL